MMMAAWRLALPLVWHDIGHKCLQDCIDMNQLGTAHCVQYVRFTVLLHLLNQILGGLIQEKVWQQWMTWWPVTEHDECRATPGWRAQLVYLVGRRKDQSLGFLPSSGHLHPPGTGPCSPSVGTRLRRQHLPWCLLYDTAFQYRLHPTFPLLLSGLLWQHGRRQWRVRPALLVTNM